jgi:hypothetical protein
MGRPLNKKNFNNSGNSIQVQFHNGVESVSGFIVSQRGTKKFLCEDAEGNQSICFMKDKNWDELLPGEMSINVRQGSDVYQTVKISAHKVTLNVGSAASWDWDETSESSLVEMAKFGEDEFGKGNNDSSTLAIYEGAAEPGMIALWDAQTVADGPVTTLSDLIGPFDLTAVAAPTSSNRIITFDGNDDVMVGATVADTGAIIPGARHVRDYGLPDASGGDAGQGFSIAGFAYDDADGTWWAVNGGLNYDGSSADRQQSLVHLSADFGTNLGEIDLDTLLPDLDTNDESPQAVAVDNAGGYLWVASPTARVIHCFDKGAGVRVPANDIARGYDIGSLCIAEDGDNIWVMSRDATDATIQKISTDGNATVSVDFTIDLDNRHDHLTEKDGLLYVSCGTNGAQAFVVAIDPVQETPLARTMLPYPGNAEGMVGIEGIQFGQDGSVFISHNGYFHYGDPGDPEAPLQWPRTNIVSEYMLPDLGGADFDLFALADVTPSGADCLLQFGSVLDSVKTLPAAGLFPNGSLSAWQMRVNNSGAGDEAQVSHTYAGPSLIYVERRGGNVTFYVNGVEAGTDTLGTDADGAWGPVHAPELGGANTNDNRHTAMDFYAAGAVLGAGANRQVIEGALAHRHNLASLLPIGHPFKETSPMVSDLTPSASAPDQLTSGV